MATKTLSKDAQIYAVQRLACFASPTEVVGELKEHFKVVVSLPAILHYDPTKRQGHDLSEELKEVFHECRLKFQTEITSIPVANAAYRLTKLQGVVERAETRKNDPLVMAALKQARDESGGKAQGAGAADSNAPESVNPANFAEHVRALKESHDAQSLVELYTDLLG